MTCQMLACVVLLAVAAPSFAADDRSPLTRARQLYNMRDYARAVQAADEARRADLSVATETVTTRSLVKPMPGAAPVTITALTASSASVASNAAIMWRRAAPPSATARPGGYMEACSVKEDQGRKWQPPMGKGVLLSLTAA